MISFIPRVGKVKTGQTSGGFTVTIPKLKAKKVELISFSQTSTLLTTKWSNVLVWFDVLGLKCAFINPKSEKVCLVKKFKSTFSP